MQLAKFSIFMLLILVSCTIIDNNDDSEIYTLLINSTVKPVPPPPPPPSETDAFLSKKIIDSLKKVPTKIAVFPNEIEFFIKNKNGKFLLNDSVKYHISDKKIDFSKLKARASISLKLIDNQDYDIKIIHKDYDGIVTISAIEYNKEKTKAVALISFSRGKLSGSLIMFYLEKKDKQWTIISNKTLLVS